jgi:hypothetical protein
MSAPRSRTSPSAVNPFRQNMAWSTVSPSAVSANPSGLRNAPLVQSSWPPMWAPKSTTSPSAVNPWDRSTEPRQRIPVASKPGTRLPGNPTASTSASSSATGSVTAHWRSSRLRGSVAL